MEKKKKGKRRNQELAVQEGVESDDTTSMSAINMGGEDSQDPLDNAVSAQQNWIETEHKRLSSQYLQRKTYTKDKGSI